MKTKIKLAVVDDHSLFRTGLASLINEFDELKVVIEAANGLELIEQIQRKKPDVILLDVEMPFMDGFETAEYIRKNYPDIKIIMLTMYNDEGIILHLLSKGVHGFLLKNNDLKIVIDAIYSVKENDYYFNESISKSMVNGLVNNKNIKSKFETVSLSDREIEVIRLICRELTNKEIAEQMFVSVRTIDGHREKILEKTKSKNTVGIVMYAVKNNLLAVIKTKKLI